MKCADCKFWTGNRKEPKQGQCRRYPPTPAGIIPQQSLVGARPQIATVFSTPETVADYWCGDFSPEFLNA